MSTVYLEPMGAEEAKRWGTERMSSTELDKIRDNRERPVTKLVGTAAKKLGIESML